MKCPKCGYEIEAQQNRAAKSRWANMTKAERAAEMSRIRKKGVKNQKRTARRFKHKADAQPKGTMSEKNETSNRTASAPAVASGDLLADSMNSPFDAANRRAKRLAHFENRKTIRAFHDGADAPEMRAAIERARAKALKAIRARKKQ